MSTLKLYPIQQQNWRKALAENRRDGHKSYFPRNCERLDHRTGTYGGYMIATGKPAEAVYIRRSIGVIEAGVAKAMLLTGRVRKRAPRRENPFQPGDKAIRLYHGADVPVVVKEVRLRTCIISFSMAGKEHQQAIPYDQLRPG